MNVQSDALLLFFILIITIHPGACVSGTEFILPVNHLVSLDFNGSICCFT